MSIYTTRWFDRWARTQGLTAASLCAAVRELQAGLVDADLGGGLFKKRIGRPGRGKSGGYRTLVATNKGDRWVSSMASRRTSAATSTGTKRKR